MLDVEMIQTLLARAGSELEGAATVGSVPILRFVNDMRQITGIRQPSCEELDPIFLDYRWQLHVGLSGSIVAQLRLPTARKRNIFSVSLASK
jgi:hypothetical protein